MTMNDSQIEHFRSLSRSGQLPSNVTKSVDNGRETWTLKDARGHVVGFYTCDAQLEAKPEPPPMQARGATPTPVRIAGGDGEDLGKIFNKAFEDDEDGDFDEWFHSAPPRQARGASPAVATSPGRAQLLPVTADETATPDLGDLYNETLGDEDDVGDVPDLGDLMNEDEDDATE